MATLDQLPADKRAIIELVLQRGQSYAELSGNLDMPEDRVRDHARDALTALAPRSADRVDPHWRAQVADYLLGQQQGPQGRATRSHLRSSEAARTWALSLLDSIGHLYRSGREPVIPARSRRSDDGEPEPAPTPSPRREDGLDGAGAAATAPPPERRLRRPGRRLGRGAGADATVRRRRIAALLAALAVVAVIVLLATGVFGGGGDDEEPVAGGDTQAAAEGPEVIGQVTLQPVGGVNGAGAAQVLEQEGQRAVFLLAKLPKTDRDEGYLLWLYNDQQDAVPIAVLQTDGRGNYQGLGPLPPEYEQFDSLDISLQNVRERGAQHSGNSVLRADLADLEEPSGDASVPEDLQGGGGAQAPAPQAPLEP
jgi:hypothetical protein